MSGGFLPWHAEAWQRLYPALAADRLPQGLMLIGQEGLGKLAFAEAVARAALCQNPGPQGACGRCATCALYAAGTHPDLLRVSPEEDSEQIKVDQIRALIEFAGLSRHYDRHKVIIIAPAEAMNPNAANSLLKTLEEPNPRTALILVASRPGRLPATVRSRCQQIKFTAPARDEALTWLEGEDVAQGEQAAQLLALAHGAPLAARDLAESDALERRAEAFKALSDLFAGRRGVVELAEAWAKGDVRAVVDWQTSWLQDAIRIRLAGEDTGLVNMDMARGLRRLAESLDLETLFGLRDRLIEARRLLGGTVNRPMLLEDILLAWLQARDAQRATA